MTTKPHKYFHFISSNKGEKSVSFLSFSTMNAASFFFFFNLFCINKWYKSTKINFPALPMILWYKELPLYILDRCQFLFSFSEKRENNIWGNQWVKQAENTPLLLKSLSYWRFQARSNTLEICLIPEGTRNYYFKCCWLNTSSLRTRSETVLVFSKEAH